MVYQRTGASGTSSSPAGMLTTHNTRRRLSLLWWRSSCSSSFCRCCCCCSLAGPVVVFEPVAGGGWDGASVLSPSVGQANTILGYLQHETVFLIVIGPLNYHLTTIVLPLDWWWGLCWSIYQAHTLTLSNFEMIFRKCIKMLLYLIWYFVYGLLSSLASSNIICFSSCSIYIRAELGLAVVPAAFCFLILKEKNKIIFARP